MFPWTQLHAWPTGEAFPCCMAPQTESTGNLHRDSIEQLWNSVPLRSLRLKMLADEPSEACVKCYQLESVGIWSERKEANNKYGHHLPVVSTTTVEGRVEKVNLAYIDIRFSNLCNFMCRTCGPAFSSKLHAEAVALGERVPSSKSLIHVTEDWPGLREQLQPHLDDVEEVLFAGGEPLIMDEQWDMLRLLHTRKQFEVRLRYITNFSELKRSSIDAIPLWRDFENVTVMASLDGMGPRGEYLRRGQRWEQVVKNRLLMLSDCPNVHFHTHFTLSLMNALHLPEFHRWWVGEGYVDAANFFVNILQDPSIFSLQTLPRKQKDEVETRYRAYAMTLDGPAAEQMIGMLAAAVAFMNGRDTSEQLARTLERIAQIDRLRGESFVAAFPEWVGLVGKTESGHESGS